MIASFVDDLRFAVRSYVKAPGFTVVAGLTLALGTGVNATVFAFVNALLFRPAAVPDPQSLVSIYTSDFSSGPYGDTSYPDYRTLQSDTTVFDTLGAHDGGASALLQTAASVERIRRTAVSAEFFQTLQIAPRSGRLIGPDDFAARIGISPCSAASARGEPSGRHRRNCPRLPRDSRASTPTRTSARCSNATSRGR